MSKKLELIESTCETAGIDSNARMRYLGCCGYCVVGDFIPARKPRPTPTDCDSRKWCGRRPARLLLVGYPPLWCVDGVRWRLPNLQRAPSLDKPSPAGALSPGQGSLAFLREPNCPPVKTAHPVLLDLGQNNRDDNAGCRASKGGGLCATILLQEKTASNFPGRMPEDAHPSMSSALSARRSSYSRRAGCFGTPAIIGMQSVIM